jgi:DeoR/GlpR family transcriptional regulator of sugar metabolism
MKRSLASGAAETSALASAEKLGTASAYRVLPLTEVAGVITDSRPAGPARRRLELARVPLPDAG